MTDPKRKGKKSSTLTDKQRQEILKLRQEGLGYMKISKAVGTRTHPAPKSTVRDFIKRAEEEAEQIAKDFEEARQAEQDAEGAGGAVSGEVVGQAGLALTDGEVEGGMFAWERQTEVRAEEALSLFDENMRRCGVCGQIISDGKRLPPVCPKCSFKNPINQDEARKWFAEYRGLLAAVSTASKIQLFLDARRATVRGHGPSNCGGCQFRTALLDVVARALEGRADKDEILDAIMNQGEVVVE